MMFGYELVVHNRLLRRERMRRAREKERHTLAQWKRLLEECGHRCVRCDRDGVHLDRDHIIPVYQGGSDGIENIQPLCARCNSGKGAESIDHRPLAVKLSIASY